jgi:hypothetical protein
MHAPDEANAMAALNRVQSLTTHDFDRRISGEIGKPLLGIFYALARSIDPEADSEALAKRVHLMVLSYLMHAELAAPTKKQ